MAAANAVAAAAVARMMQLQSIRIGRRRDCLGTIELDGNGKLTHPHPLPKHSFHPRP